MKRLSSIIVLLLLVISASAGDNIKLRSCNTGKNMKHAITRGAEQKPVKNLIGSKRQLVVLASFADKQFQESNPLLLWNRIFNEVGFSEGRFCGSVHDYFYDQSYGKFQVQFDLLHVNLASNRKKYASTVTDDENSKYLIYDIVDSLNSRGGIDWAPYDWDNDGNIEQLIVIYAGKGQNHGGDSETIWPHYCFLTQHTDGQPKTVSSGGRNYQIDEYCCIQEIDGNNEYGSFGTICHEYSHCFCLPDIYYGSISYLQHWDLMDMGNYNEGGFRPCNYSAQERMLTGWIDIQELSAPTEISHMAALSEKPEAYLVRNNDYTNEYFVIENRQKKGWDASLPGSGVVIFHIDYNEAIWKEYGSFINDDKNKIYRYLIIPANNDSSSSAEKDWGYPYESNDSLTNLSTPASTLWHENIDNTKYMSKPIRHIKIENELASFSFMADTPSSVITASSEAVRQEAVYDLYGRKINTGEMKAGIYIIRYNNGENKKVVVR